MGKCTLASGKNPAHSFYKGKGPVCEQMCDESSECHGFSVSNFSNCLLWEESGLQGGGMLWSGAHCFVQQAAHISARTTQSCSCTAETCYWKPAKDCVSHFQYNGLNYTDCTTADYSNKGWCSLDSTYEAKGWKHCTLSCPEGCYWQQPATCVPRPRMDQPCWTAPNDCAPEFWYKGKLYAGCTTIDDHEGAWCSQNYRFATEEKWSRCKPCCAASPFHSLAGLAELAASSAFIGILCVSMPVMFFFRKRLHSPRSIGSWALTSAVEF